MQPTSLLLLLLSACGSTTSPDDGDVEDYPVARKAELLVEPDGQAALLPGTLVSGTGARSSVNGLLLPPAAGNANAHATG